MGPYTFKFKRKQKDNFILCYKWHAESQNLSFNFFFNSLNLLWKMLLVWVDKNPVRSYIFHEVNIMETTFPVWQPTLARKLSWLKSGEAQSGMQCWVALLGFIRVRASPRVCSNKGTWNFTHSMEVSKRKVEAKDSTVIPATWGSCYINFNIKRKTGLIFYIFPILYF